MRFGKRERDPGVIGAVTHAPSSAVGAIAGRGRLVRVHYWRRVRSERNLRTGTRAARNSAAMATERDWLYEMGELAERIRAFSCEATLLNLSAT